MTTLTAAALRRRLREAHPGVLLVGARILRRVVRLDRRLSRLRAAGLRRSAYVIDRNRLLAYAEESELGIEPNEDLPPRVILLPEPTDEGPWTGRQADEVLWQARRLLLHATAYLEMEQILRRQTDLNAFISERIQEIGQVEFTEIRAVLARDGMLFADATDADVYREFVATYLELQYFGPRDLPLFFPAIQDWERIARCIERDVTPASLYAVVAPLAPDSRTDSTPATEGRRDTKWPWSRWWRGGTSEPKRVEMGSKSEAATASSQADTRAAARDFAAEHALQAAETELRYLIERLQRVLHWSREDADQALIDLSSLLPSAAAGFGTQEGRLMHDLQKICSDYERDVFQVDFWGWLWHRGRRPFRRPLPLLREVLTAKHLKSAIRRLPQTDLTEDQLARMTHLLRESQRRLEEKTRTQASAVIERVFDQVGLTGQHPAEECARRKVVAELLDHIEEQGVANISHLRDALSKNDLKLPDLSSLRELFFGDRLLRADRQLGKSLTGLYRPGAIYMRGAHRISSVGFGTPFGRFVTRYFVLPFGGSLLIVEGFKHLIGLFSGKIGHPSEEVAAAVVIAESQKSSHEVYYLIVGLVGLWLGGMIHVPPFRQAFFRWLDMLRVLICRTFIDLPRALLRWPPLRNLLDSPAFEFFRGYVLGPTVMTGLIYGGFYLVGRRLESHVVVQVFLVSALIVNSTVGRFLEEWTSDMVLRTWEDLRLKVFAALYRWIMDVFQRLLAAIDRILYAVDAWLRFRTGDRPAVQSVKLVGAACWSVVSYFVVFVFTLLVEPQVNPIKHFPVVTVSHKLILPFGPAVVEELAPYIGNPRANTLVWTTIWLIPGVFGFLVWELKENWRLYAANRPKSLSPVPFGQHGETMLRMLRTGLHSGTLPKLFARLRSLAIAAQNTGRRAAFEKKRGRLDAIAQSVRSFVERDFLAPLKLAATQPELMVPSDGIRLATNRIEVRMRGVETTTTLLAITWDDSERVIAADVQIPGAVPWASERDHALLLLALTGLLQMSDTQRCQTPDVLPVRLTPALTWEEWSQAWQAASQTRPREVVAEEPPSPTYHP